MKSLVRCLMVFFCLFLASFLFLSCASKPKFSGQADLCGLVVDENNNPVTGVVIYCTKDGLLNKSAITNDSGVFVIQNVSSGNLYLSGQKENYTRLEKTEYLFHKRTEIICFQITSFKGAIKKTEDLLLRNERQLAFDLLESIECEKFSEEEALINAYKFFISKEGQEQKRLLSEIKKTKGAHTEFLNNYCDLLEACIK